MNWRALIFRKRAEVDLDDELEFHVEMQARKNVLQGMGEEEAWRRARMQFGGGSQVREECREARGISLIETTWQDVRYALRGFRRSPAFVLTVVATIALGLGLNTALFTIFNATYFRPIGVRDAQSLYEVFWIDRTGAGHDYTWPQYREFLTENPAFSEVLAYQHTESRLDGRTVLGTLVTEDYFRVLGVGGALGRTVLPADSSLVVLSYRFWQNHFSGDPDIAGKKVLLRGHPYEVAGVAREGFAGLGSRPSDFWAPLEHAQAVSIVGRLKPEFSERQARASLTLWAQRFTTGNSNNAKAMQAMLVSRATTKPLNFKSTLTFSPLAVAFLLVLLIACANVANMMLARSASRQREIGIRLSLGAARRRLIRQLLTESILLALPSAVVAIAVSQAALWIGVRVLVATLQPGVSDFAARIPQLSTDIRVFGFTLIAALFSAVLFGLAPALQATKGDFSKELRPSRLRNALVISQVTVCLLLLVTASVLLRGVDRIHSLKTNLSARNTIEIVVREKSREKVLNRIASEPSVEVVASGGNAPVERKRTISVDADGGGTTLNTDANDVSPEYFAMFEIPIVRGRNFTTAESRAEAPVAIVSQTTARRLWPNQDAVGRSLRIVQHRAVTVVGIAHDEISRWINGGGDTSLVYFPSNPHAASNHLFLTARGDFETARRKIEADLTASDPDAVELIRKMQVQEWVAEDTYYTTRLAYWLSSSIGILALLLTLSGIYGVISYVITQRTKEIGIRMALGATSASVTGLMLKQSIGLASIGILAGSVLALGMSKALASVLVMINTFDAMAYIGGASLVLGACVAAAYLPSRRASRVDPLRTLRYD